MYIALYSVRNRVKDWSLFSRQVALTNKSPLASLTILRYKNSRPARRSENNETGQQTWMIPIHIEHVFKWKCISILLSNTEACIMYVPRNVWINSGRCCITGKHLYSIARRSNTMACLIHDLRVMIGNCCFHVLFSPTELKKNMWQNHFRKRYFNLFGQQTILCYFIRCSCMDRPVLCQ